MKKGVFFFLCHLTLLIQSAKGVFQIPFQDPVVPGVSETPLFRGDPGQVLNLTVIISAVGEIE